MKTIKNIALTLFIIMCANTVFAQSKALFSVQDITVAVGQDVEVPIEVNNPMAFNGLQLSVTLPEGLEFAPYQEGKDGSRVKWAKLNRKRCEDTHSVASGKAPKNNKMTFLAYSPQNEAFVGMVGEILRFKVRTSEFTSPGVYYVMIDNMEFSDLQNKSIGQDAITAKIIVVETVQPTALESVDAESDDNEGIYNILGQRVAASKSGVYIRNNQKYIKK